MSDIPHQNSEIDVDAQVELGRRYLLGEGMPKDDKKAFELFKAAAESGDPDAEAGLACCYMNGRAVLRDSPKALQMLQDLADRNNAWAFYALGIYFHTKEKGSDNRRSLELLEKALAAPTKYPTIKRGAAQTLATWYGTGSGVAVDAKKGIYYSEMAADLGSVPNQILMGLRYWTGDGVAKDLKRGFDYCMLAAEKGDEYAAKFLGEKFEWGGEFPANFDKAREIYDSATKAGSKIAPHLALALDASEKCSQAYANGGTNEVEKPLVNCSEIYSELDLSKLKAEAFYNIAMGADINGDDAHAMEFYQRCVDCDTFKTRLTETTRRDLRRLIYLRKRGFKNYFEAVACSTVLHQVKGREIKVYVPSDKDGYSQEAKNIIFEAMQEWIDALGGEFSFRETHTEIGATFRFQSVDKEIFYGNAVARTCYLGDSGKRLLEARSQTLIQLPSYEVRSSDDRLNFKAVCLHEIGHAFGLRGHSIFARDVMFGRRQHLAHLSPGDKHAIRSLYTDNAEEYISDILGRENENKNAYALGRTGIYLYARGLHKEAVVKLESASKLGDEQAQLTLGLHYWKSLNFVAARKQLDLAVANGVPGALMFRNALYGVGGNSKDTIAGLKKAAEFGNTYALTLLGMIYTFGDESLPKDAKKGAALLQQAIDQGSMLAHFCLAVNKAMSSVETVFKREE